jgi:hypothetical protein
MVHVERDQELLIGRSNILLWHLSSIAGTAPHASARRQCVTTNGVVTALADRGRAEKVRHIPLGLGVAPAGSRQRSPFPNSEQPSTAHGGLAVVLSVQGLPWVNAYPLVRYAPSYDRSNVQTSIDRCHWCMSCRRAPDRPSYSDS